MNNKFKIILITFLMCPFFINAATVKLDCPEATKNGAEITCKIKISSTEIVAGFQANVKASSGLVYKSYTKSSGWAGSSSASKFLIYDNTVKGDQTLGTYKYKVNTTSTANLTVTLSSIQVSNTNGGAISANSTASDTIRIMETDNTLKSLTINGVSVQNFSSSTLNYTYKTEASSIKIAATANSSRAKITGTGTKTVNYGTNTYSIVVKAEDGTSKTYKITVTRPDNRETINTLESLSIDGYTITPTFNQNTKEYSLTVENNIESVKINASKTSTKSSFVSGFGPREQKLNYGENKVYVKVKAENEKVNIYTITIKRKDNRSTNNSLKSLTPSTGNIAFDKNTLNYSMLTDQDEITISAQTEDEKATISGLGTIKLKNGLNEIKIVVKAENETEKTYTIKITKVDDFSTLNISNNLQQLEILKKYPFEFNKEQTEYTLTIGDETALSIRYKPEDENSIVEITGNENLQDGSVITIKVTSIDGKEKEYKINIKKEVVEEPTTKSNSKLILILLIVSVLLNVVLTILVSKKDDKKETKKAEEKPKENESEVEEETTEEKVEEEKEETTEQPTPETEEPKSEPVEEVIEEPAEENKEEEEKTTDDELQEIPDEIIIEDEPKEKDNE